ncbi:MAG TPA: group III truncated hemoglobin [Chitinophagales bacterium]|nr:group III truncated hemoglobin [Chitinophagales bacterium]MCB0512411.1 group III truncated hemoglobin [Bacteroidota bacterium]MCB9074669.1 group III truncated hemoglobin [Chitinophagales bacterium]HMU97602.1 group III truncated hemoglobin [Chitinophagales bacterium]HMV03583.1 group III truncated hemoglobin [Chitinophagales bacterium]
MNSIKMPDIKDINDIETIILDFYEKVKVDKLLRPFFFGEKPTKWEKHIPLMISFWENVLFYSGNYEGDPLLIHRKINKIKATETKHFERWNNLFDETVNAHFKGANAEKMKQHAQAIAEIMLSKIEPSN